MTMRFGAVFAGLALAGCATVVSPAPKACDAALAQAFIGQSASAAEQARIASKSASVRVIAPGTAVTMDFRPDRLNVETDEAGIIVTLRCG